jgi:predicted nucleotidyltransferase
VHRLELFGSAADNRHVISDLDFLVEFQLLDPDTYADAYFGLLEDLERLFGRPVDLIMTSAVTNPYFLEGIARNRTTIYGSHGDSQRQIAPGPGSLRSGSSISHR